MEYIIYIIVCFYIWIFMIYYSKRDLIKNVKMEDLKYF